MLIKWVSFSKFFAPSDRLHYLQIQSVQGILFLRPISTSSLCALILSLVRETRSVYVLKF